MPAPKLLSSLPDLSYFDGRFGPGRTSQERGPLIGWDQTNYVSIYQLIYPLSWPVLVPPLGPKVPLLDP